jgi:hypothetical protein
MLGNLRIGAEASEPGDDLALLLDVVGAESHVGAAKVHFGFGRHRRCSLLEAGAQAVSRPPVPHVVAGDIQGIGAARHAVESGAVAAIMPLNLSYILSCESNLLVALAFSAAKRGAAHRGGV